MMKPEKPRWTPGGFAPDFALTGHITLLIMMVIRGMDYATGESPTSAHRLGAVEHAAPLWLWGIGFTIAAAIGLSAMSWRWGGGVIFAHTAGAGLYAAVGVGILIDAIDRIHDTGGTPSWVVIIPLTAAAITAVGAWRERGLSITVTCFAALAVILGLLAIYLDGLRNATILIGIAALHVSFAIGTAQKATQDRIRKDREANCG